MTKDPVAEIFTLRQYCDLAAFLNWDVNRTVDAIMDIFKVDFATAVSEMTRSTTRRQMIDDQDAADAEFDL